MSDNPKMIRVLNTVNGQVREVSAALLDFDEFKKWNVPVDDSVRSFEPGLYTPKTADEYNRMQEHTRIIEPAPDSESQTFSFDINDIEEED